MVRTMRPDADAVDMLNDLIQIEYGAIHAYEAAIGRIDNSEHQRQLTAFKDNHERHTRELDHVVRELHAKPVNGALIRSVVTAEEIAITDMMNDDAVLKSIKSNEDDARRAYERAAGRSDLPPAVVSVVHAALGDERQHRDWIEKAIAAA